MNAIEKLATVTYALQHNPNCPSPYLIRLIAPERARIDLKPYGGPMNASETKDILGFGRTLEEAAERAFEAQRVATELYWEKLRESVRPKKEVVAAL